MAGFEYRVIEHTSFQELETTLNELAADGWRVMSSTASLPRESNLPMKRPGVFIYAAVLERSKRQEAKLETPEPRIRSLDDNDDAEPPAQGENDWQAR
jgi:hypothetical protein